MSHLRTLGGIGDNGIVDFTLVHQSKEVILIVPLFGVQILKLNDDVILKIFLAHAAHGVDRAPVVIH